MKTNAAIKHFGSESALAEALGISLSAIYQTSWQESPPWLRQVQIQMLTNGKLKAGPRPPKRAIKRRVKAT